jgi:hypothetical protein
MVRTKGGVWRQFIETDIPNITKLICYFPRWSKYGCKVKNWSHKGILLSRSSRLWENNIDETDAVRAASQQSSLKNLQGYQFWIYKDGYAHRYSHGHNTHVPNIRTTVSMIWAPKTTSNTLNECNVIAEIILSRYDIYTVKNIQTHITTNLSASEIENAYGNQCSFPLASHAQSNCLRQNNTWQR